MSTRTIARQAGFLRVDMDMFNKLRADLHRNRNARVRVGILGGSNGRIASATDHSPVAMTNAELGAIHEFGAMVPAPDGSFGSIKIPARSFLIMPVVFKLPDDLKKTNLNQWGEIILLKGIRVALGLLGAFALSAIHQAFDTGGFGHWAPLAPVTVRRKMKKGHSASSAVAILIDTAQLRQAITAEVVP